MTVVSGVQVSADDQVLVVRGDTSLSDVYAALPGGLYPPFPNVELPGGVGGLVARGGFGQTFFFAGDVLGASFRTRSGTVVRAGGRVVKNVQGYDLTRLLVGSFGVLGDVLDVTLRLRPGRSFMRARREGRLEDVATLPVTPRFAWEDEGVVYVTHFGGAREVARLARAFAGEDVGGVDFTPRFPRGVGVGTGGVRDRRFSWVDGGAKPSVPALFEALAERL